MRRTLAISAFTLALGAFAGQAYAERQPHMRSALRNLEQALEQLQKASSDKGGHRVKAIGHVKDAIEETKKGIEFDNKN